MKERLSAAIKILVPPSLVHRQPLLLFVGAAATGIVVDSVVNLSASVWSVLTISLIGLFAVLHIRRSAKPVATTVIALIPIFTSTGRGADIMIPMAIPSFGGMLVVIITIFVVPVLFSLLQEIQLKWSSRITT